MLLELHVCMFFIVNAYINGPRRKLYVQFVNLPLILYEAFIFYFFVNEGKHVNDIRRLRLDVMVKYILEIKGICWILIFVKSINYHQC